MSTGHIVTTSPLRFHLTLFVRTHEEDAKLSFIFEADDVYAAADKLTAIERRLGKSPGILNWKILSVVQIKTSLQ